MRAARPELPTRTLARRLRAHLRPLPWVLHLAVGVSAWAAWFGLGSGAPASAQPHRSAAANGSTTTGAVRRNGACVACHTEEAKEWSADQHHTAFTDDHFQRAYAREPLPYCRSCHAPESTGPSATAALALGVACTSCHPPPEASDTAASILVPTPTHPPLRRLDAGPSSACASCHQFPFPPGDHQPVGLMQRTIDEHARSPFASISCAECHMPQVTVGGVSRRSHAFEGGHTPDFVRKAVQITATRAGGRLDLVFDMRRVGHSFPTGDLFRRIAIVAEALGPDELVVADASLFLARHFERRLGEAGAVDKVEVRDDRLESGERRVVSLDLGSDAAQLPIRYSVAYERLDLPVETVVHRDGRVVRGPPARVDARVVLASGDLPVARSPR